jgi:hypothetical protein
LTRTLGAALPIFAVLNLLAAVPAHAAGGSQGVSQITLSCTTPPPDAGSHPKNQCSSSQSAPIFSDGTADFIGGFWIWCQNPSGTGTPYGPDCSGSMYIEEISQTSAVYESTSVSGGATDLSGIQVTATTSDGDVTCTFDVTPGSSTLDATCNGTPITFSNATVNVT